jgi:hypothetical protein
MFYIKVVNGQPVDHPILADNLNQLFPYSEIPSEYVPFVRVQSPKEKVYKVLESSYGWVDGVVQDIWTYRDMTQEELDKRPCIYIDTNTNEYPIYEINIRDIHPEIPEDLTGVNFPAPSNYAKVKEVDPPETDGTLAQYFVELPPVKINNIWTQQWEFKTRTAAQIAIVEKHLNKINSSQESTT